MDNLPINITDLALIALLVISGLLAFSRGFVREVLSILAWVVSFVVALQFYPRLSPYVLRYIESEQIATAIAFGAIFVVSLVVLWVVSSAISRRVQNSDVGALDRSLGFLFGLLRGAVIVSLLYLLLLQFLPPREHPAWLREARAIPMIEYGTNLLIEAAPEHISAGLQSAEDIGRAATGNIQQLLNAGGALKGVDVQKVYSQWQQLSATQQQKLLQQLSPDKQRQLQQMLQQSESGTDSGGDTGYKSSERQGLERLLRTRNAE